MITIKIINFTTAKYYKRKIKLNEWNKLSSGTIWIDRHKVYIIEQIDKDNKILYLHRAYNHK